MPYIKDMDECQLYGCRNPQHDDPSAVITVVPESGANPVELLVCIYHQALLEAGSDHYAIGRAFTGEIELRPIPAHPAE